MKWKSHVQTGQKVQLSYTHWPRCWKIISPVDDSFSKHGQFNCLVSVESRMHGVRWSHVWMLYSWMKRWRWLWCLMSHDVRRGRRRIRCPRETMGGLGEQAKNQSGQGLPRHHHVLPPWRVLNNLHGGRHFFVGWVASINQNELHI